MPEGSTGMQSVSDGLRRHMENIQQTSESYFSLTWILAKAWSSIVITEN